ncbi:hypothetical protein A3H89_01410 [Candidatus Amesbacteria bacterium RIFCSPLOWO2_02_FULL_48_11]|uniref:SLC41A/MgtE integral membrane domain-containing protein n=4 Tax=Candidatus Amesiibacteriota TaxID=1752730 RepID=A0A1F4ZFR7_9BACT|nr:MAG: MgtE integral membrane protein [Candidatus Amesbacteria bacterium GW2011_GWA2_47_11]KKU93831.1 MAG: MgtE integral membrane protein [Candidatus Amesbacteria bacterium GW2011_GWC1_48_10]KKU99632.1 MAG: MgtE integral membrane protein [Candidatus Amesbacteria bacterium GW2011_GWA1_48_9]OGC90145.1 MAG: hypothetical protein A2V48_01070 [Candidatus Amesbacteria bacterium RBG_19FT_COMBO_48_16]OGC96438.1 MAG: hypothetical protein A3C34_02980 [Candidatus Amesbacteria bacterium RIFCSPHIGHO2_02_FUL
MIRAVKKVIIDEAHWRLSRLVRLRLPWLVAGLAVGLAGSVLMGRFEQLLAQNISLVFFVPIIVYMSDAVGTQTEIILVRDLGGKRVNFGRYLTKELLLGFYMGLVLGILIGAAAWVWLRSAKLAVTVGLAMFINVTVAPLVAVLVAEVLFKEKADPALGAGPLTTVIQDVISLLIYLVIAAAILWN